jgi:23S rRNA (uracil1939-C5)-methyltransferase
MVKKNEVCNLEINGMTHEGQGVGRIDNFTVFVDGALEGERVEVKIIKVDKSYAVGKLLKILQPSPKRTEPFCPVYKRCGGCSLQHADYQAQLRFKANVVRESLKRIGGLEGVTVHPAIGMEKPLKYRNKAQYPVSPGEDPAIGFYAKRSHEVIDSDTCGIQGEASEKVKAVVRKFISDKGISIYDESTGRGLIRHIMVRTGFRTGEVMAVLVINGDSLPAERELVKRSHMQD